MKYVERHERIEKRFASSNHFISIETERHTIFSNLAAPNVGFMLVNTNARIWLDRPVTGEKL